MKPFLILCYIGCTLGKLKHDSGSDYAFVDLSNVLEHKTRHKRQTDEAPCDLKEELFLPVSYKNHKKTLQLKKNNQFSPETIPLLIQDEAGYLVKKKKVKKNEVTALYYYEEDGLRFPIMVKCRFKKDCSSSRCEITGDLLTKDKLIQILGSAADKKAEYDIALDEVPHNVDYLGGEEDNLPTGTDDPRVPGLDAEGHPDAKLPPVLKSNKKLKMDDILSEEAIHKIANEKQKNKGKRKKRQTEEHLFGEEENVIDLLLTNDFQFYQQFKNLDGIEKTEEEAVALMVEQVAFYASSAHEDAAAWSENPIELTDTEIHLDADKALDALVKYVYNNSYLMLDVDHVMAFTGQDLVRNNTQLKILQRAVKGYTFYDKDGIICKQPWYAVSIVESPAIGFVARTAAHELAHNLRCSHDVTPGCSTEEQFEMSPNFNAGKSTYKNNPYKFSPCSIESIHAHLKNLSGLISNETTYEPKYECLKHHSVNSDFSFFDESVLAGQRYQLNDQCRYLMKDPYSRTCLLPSPSYCWDFLYCLNSKDGYCYGVYAYNGSPCNATSICYFGNCMLKNYILNITTTEAPSTTFVTKLTTTTEGQSTPEVTTEKESTTEEATTSETEITTTTSEVSALPEVTTEKESTEEVTTSATQLTTTEDPNLPQWSQWTLCSKKCDRLRTRFCGSNEECKGRIKQYEACTTDFCEEDTAKSKKTNNGNGRE
ncbi:Hypothetical predicted protein [Mytilus galloprovincialis]|uniref:Peptidase M12B domain-containing protein n=1 Tax=Mytilus galloprovincialis TaxID=29158 RepID=A0A8B6E0F5_MYTGA|nr:Hypothetical predicted protein [Mytilus galloprovincialis]